MGSKTTTTTTTATLIPKLTLAKVANGFLLVTKPNAPPSAPTKFEAAVDPYELPSSPQPTSSTHSSSSAAVTAADETKKPSNPSPEPPVLVAEGDLSTR